MYHTLNHILSRFIKVADALLIFFLLNAGFLDFNLNYPLSIELFHPMLGTYKCDLLVFSVSVIFGPLILFILVGFKAAVTDIRYFARSKFSRSLVHKKNFDLIWQVAFKLKTFFVSGRRIPLLSLNKLGEVTQTTIILCNFVNKSSYWFIVSGKCFSLVKI